MVQCGDYEGLAREALRLLSDAVLAERHYEPGACWNVRNIVGRPCATQWLGLYAELGKQRQ